LVLGWVGAVLWAYIFETTGLAFGFGVLAVCTWVAWGVFLAWLFGIRRRMKRHLGYSLKAATFLEKEISASRVADVRRALESLYGDKVDDRTRRYGVEFGYASSFGSLQENDREIKSLQWMSVESQPGRFENFPTNAVYLLFREEQPFAAYLQTPAEAPAVDHEEGFEQLGVSHGIKLQVFAESVDEAARVLEYVLRVASVSSVYRGKMLHVSPRGSGLPGQTIRVADRPLIDPERIVLPPHVLEVVRRSVSARLEFHNLLQRHGHISKTGILLYGPPGTGKTLVAKQLIGACQNHTAVVPAGMETETIREAFRLAAYLQPALIVIEDVDLLAARRESNANVTSLQELMNEMDGLLPSTEAIVLMTTNRPDVLEPALASRPGRVSQAVLFPLPDAPLREKLLRMFCAKADVTQVNFPQWIERTDGASPAFLEELSKRAILFAAERLVHSSSSDAVKLTDADFDRAIHELVVFGGSLTSRLLGFPENPRRRSRRQPPAASKRGQVGVACRTAPLHPPLQTDAAPTLSCDSIR
ncbi:MAG: AAA family ATPase, partial [Planctomycetes bacterium]|nr:AAA family ATPase [Planctomycetota bacterium]